VLFKTAFYLCYMPLLQYYGCYMAFHFITYTVTSPTYVHDSLIHLNLTTLHTLLAKHHLCNVNECCVYCNLPKLCFALSLSIWMVLLSRSMGNYAKYSWSVYTVKNHFFPMCYISPFTISLTVMSWVLNGFPLTYFVYMHTHLLHLYVS